MKISNKHLRTAYETYNNLFFDNKLPMPRKLMFKAMPIHHGLTSVGQHYVDVFIDEGLQCQGVYVFISLLHEMAHVKLWMQGYHSTVDGGHDLLHCAELVRLFNIGAYEGLL